jgi:hypothetical protein
MPESITNAVGPGALVLLLDCYMQQMWIAGSGMGASRENEAGLGSLVVNSLQYVEFSSLGP